MPDGLPTPAATSVVAEHALRQLEFHKLLRLIADSAASEASEQAVLGLRPLSARHEIELRLRQVAELLRLSEEATPLRIARFADITPLLAKARPEGAVLEGDELAGFMPVLANIDSLLEQSAGRDDLPALRELLDHLTGFPDILRSLERSLDSEGGILDSASALLAELRGEVRRLEARIRKRLEEMVRDERVALFLQDDFITQRSGRWVIPVRMDSKGQVEGVVHDVSKSGETAFMEPLAIINLANELENLIAEQRAEEIRILRALSAALRGAADGLEAQFRLLVSLDTLRCVSRLAEQFRMQIPLINEEAVLRLVSGRHPLLERAFQRRGESRRVVPLEVRLGGADTVMVITGSNAGGKTIAIKTIGLLLSMALSGMPVPADSASSFPLVSSLLIDIGDEQSIEQSLSTFAAHVENVAAILKRADAATLVLIDELGTGTDPEEGAALACAVLKELRAKEALVFATTHLTEIKGFVHRTGGMVNASMEFDAATLSPLFRLRVGEPGQSHALAIARRYGLPDSIIESARGLLGGIKIEFDNLIADLNEKRAAYEKGLAEIERQRTELEEMTRAAAALRADAEQRQRETLARAYRDAADLVADVKRRMHALLEEAKRQEREKGREAIKEAGRLQEELSAKLRELAPEAPRAPSIDEITEGDVVFVRSLGYDVPIAEVNLRHNRVKVRAGNKELEVPLSEVEFKRGKKAEPERATRSPGAPERTLSARLMLVGLRADEALSRLEPFLNHAAMEGFGEVTIVHGIGAGILRKVVREHLDGHPLVKAFRSGEPKEGGGGVTVATLA